MRFRDVDLSEKSGEEILGEFSTSASQAVSILKQSLAISLSGKIKLEEGTTAVNRA